MNELHFWRQNSKMTIRFKRYNSNLNFRAKICKNRQYFSSFSLNFPAKSENFGAKFQIRIVNSGHYSKISQTYNLNFPAKIARCASKKRWRMTASISQSFFIEQKVSPKAKYKRKCKSFLNEVVAASPVLLLISSCIFVPSFPSPCIFLCQKIMRAHKISFASGSNGIKTNVV